jgi:hypothetical protein
VHNVKGQALIRVHDGKRAPTGGSPRELFFHHARGSGLDLASSSEGNFGHLFSFFLSHRMHAPDNTNYKFYAHTKCLRLWVKTEIVLRLWLIIEILDHMSKLRELWEHIQELWEHD